MSIDEPIPGMAPQEVQEAAKPKPQEHNVISPTDFEPRRKNEFDFKKGVFEEETQIDNEPKFQWKEILGEIYTQNGVKDIDLNSERWDSLEQDMREGIVLRHYLQPIEEFALLKAPEVWNYIKKYCEGFVPEKSSDMGKVHEGGTIIKLNPDALIADVRSNDDLRMFARLALIVHEAKHIELNEYLMDKSSLPEGKDNALTERSFRGYMMREEECWRYKEEIYRRLTGKELTRKWEDVKEIYSRRYR